MDGDKKALPGPFSVKLCAFGTLAMALLSPHFLLKQATFYFDNVLRKMDVVNAFSRHTQPSTWCLNK